MKTVEVFYKNKELSLQALEKVNIVLDKYKDTYKISYYVITDSTNMSIIKKYNLSETHFPFAIVINGRFLAKINNNKIYFVHFPLFMHGIGRHEGNWSIDNLETVLIDNTLLLDESILMESEHNEGNVDSCPE